MTVSPGRVRSRPHADGYARPVATRVRLNKKELERLLTSPAGPVVRELHRRAALVEAEAKRLLTVQGAVDTGRLRSSITRELVRVNGKLVIRVGTNVHYARYVEEGTGIYGPRKRPIRPVRAKVLAFVPKGQTRVVFAKQVRGMRARPYLVPALAAANGRSTI